MEQGRGRGCRRRRLPSRRHPRLEFGEPVLDENDLHEACVRQAGIELRPGPDTQEPVGTARNPVAPVDLGNLQIPPITNPVGERDAVSFSGAGLLERQRDVVLAGCGEDVLRLH